MKLPLSKEKKTEVIQSIVQFATEELEVDISEMQAGFLLEYFAKEIAPFAYNEGIEDAKRFLLEKAEDLGATCFEEGLTYWQSKEKGNRSIRRKPTG
ncbi:DUF2164 domain-containing protein [bacterium]|nr:DUF2164 domain-containing protein [bacterium]